MSLIRLTRASRNSTNPPDSYEITVNTGRIMFIEDYDGPDEGESRIWLENGRQLVVMESQDEIREGDVESKQETNKSNRSIL